MAVTAAIALPLSAFLVGICGKFAKVVHRYVGLSWTWLLPRVFELIGIRDLYYVSEKLLPLVDYG